MGQQIAIPLRVFRPTQCRRNDDHVAVVGDVQQQPLSASRGPSDTRPLLEMESGYRARAMHLLPRQGSDAPWVVHTKYALDRAVLRSAPVDGPALRFTESMVNSTATPFEVAAR